MWYLREFDYLPSQLKYYPTTITEKFMKYALNKGGFFDIFETREEAEKASNEIKRLIELQII